jgi:hypothetical protein
LIFIRKHRRFVVILLALVFVVFTKQQHEVNLVFDSADAHQTFIKNNFVPFHGQFSDSKPDRISCPSFVVKKQVADKLSFHQVKLQPGETVHLCNAVLCFSGFKLLSLLKLLCILRI